MDLTDAQWAVLEPTFRPRRRPDGRGRPWTDPRAVLNGVLWVLRTGAPWHDLPRRYPPYQTCHRRFQAWQRSGRLDRLLQRLAEDLRDRGKIDLSEAFVDATFASAKKGALKSVQLAVATGRRETRTNQLSRVVSKHERLAHHDRIPEDSTTQSLPRRAHPKTGFAPKRGRPPARCHSSERDSPRDDRESVSRVAADGARLGRTVDEPSAIRISRTVGRYTA